MPKLHLHPKRLAHIAQIIFLCLAGFSMLGAGNPEHRFDKLGHHLMCTCGCSEVLLECNHVGCPVSGPMISELHAQMATALPDLGILQWFAAKYGPVVLAAPIRGGFDLVAWIVPFAMLALGIAGVVSLAGLWRRRHARLSSDPAVPAAPIFSESVRDRIRRDTDFDS